MANVQKKIGEKDHSGLEERYYIVKTDGKPLIKQIKINWRNKSLYADMYGLINKCMGKCMNWWTNVWGNVWIDEQMYKFYKQMYGKCMDW